MWPKRYGGFVKGQQYQADSLLSGGTGRVQVVTIHNTGGTANAETYTRAHATWPNANMNDVRVHYYVDDVEAWQNLQENEVGWHAADGATGPGNNTTIAIEIPMCGSAIKNDAKAEDNGALLAAFLLDRYGLTTQHLYTHKHWYAKKQCPEYILPHWDRFVEREKAYMKQIAPQAEDTANYTRIAGDSVASAAQMRAYLLSKNPDAPDFAEIYAQETQAEGIRADVAFAQFCIGTANFKFGGDVKPEQNNFCGLGATGGGVAGCSFITPREGIRAQVQHLKAYAKDAALFKACVDPRFKYVKCGAAPYVEWLGIPDNPQCVGWAGGKGYGAAILLVMREIAAMETEPPAPVEPPQDTNKTVTLEAAAEVLRTAGVTTIQL